MCLQEEGEEPAEEKAEEKKEEEEPALWEETFKTFHDAKPHGRYSLHRDTVLSLSKLKK